MVAADIVVSLGVLAAFYSLLALGMNVKYGHTGLLDFGHVAFYLIGAYTAALIVLPAESGGPDTVYVIGLNMPWVVAAIAAMVVSGIIGAFVALPTLRLREDYLAITVLGVSAIFQRIVQAETWLVNGPDALRGITPPLTGLFPVGGESVVGAVGFALIGGMIWGVTTWALGTLTNGDGTEAGSGFARRLYTIGVFGTDRIFGDGTDTETETETAATTQAGGLARRHKLAIAGGVVAGVLGGVLTFVAAIGLTVWGTLMSVYTWLVLLTGLYRYADFSPVDYLATLALGTGYMLALAPMFFLDRLLLWIGLTIVAFGGLIGGTVYLSRNWAPFRANPFRYGAFIAFWFGIIWYYPIQILSSLLAGELQSVGQTLFNNTVWMLSFSGLTPQVGYSRFQLFLFGTLAILSLYLMELTVESPFGRVLRAVRNDERVVNSLGKDPFLYKVQSMAIGSALAGLAGALAALYFQTLVFTMFAPRVTFIALLMMFLGGVGNNRAMIVGAFLFWAFQIATTQMSSFVAPGLRENIQAFRFVVMGVLFLVLLYYRPEGLMGERSRAGVNE